MSAGLRFCSKMLQQRIGKILVDHGQGRAHLLSQDVSELFLASELKVRDLIVSTHIQEHFLCVVRRFFRYDHQSGFSGLYRLLCGELATSYLAGFLRQAQQAQEQQEALRMEPQLAEVFAGWADGYEYSEAEAAFRPFLYIELLEDYLSADVALAAVRRLEELGWSQS